MNKYLKNKQNKEELKKTSDQRKCYKSLIKMMTYKLNKNNAGSQNYHEQSSYI